MPIYLLQQLKEFLLLPAPHRPEYKCIHEFKGTSFIQSVHSNCRKKNDTLGFTRIQS